MEIFISGMDTYSRYLNICPNKRGNLFCINKAISSWSSVIFSDRNNIFPRRLFYRSLIIVAAPIILHQITITVVFFDRLWIKANKGMTRSLVGEIVTLVDLYDNEAEFNKKIITELYNQNFNFSIKFLENETLPSVKTNLKSITLYPYQRMGLYNSNLVHSNLLLFQSSIV